MSHTEWCSECSESFTASSKRKAEQQLNRHIETCTPTVSDDQPDLEQALNRARRELGDW
jgi:hypothetical protein